MVRQGPQNVSMKPAHLSSHSNDLCSEVLKYLCSDIQRQTHTIQMRPRWSYKIVVCDTPLNPDGVARRETSSESRRWAHVHHTPSLAVQKYRDWRQRCKFDDSRSLSLAKSQPAGLNQCSARPLFPSLGIKWDTLVNLLVYSRIKSEWTGAYSPCDGHHLTSILCIYIKVVKWIKAHWLMVNWKPVRLSRTSWLTFM